MVLCEGLVDGFGGDGSYIGHSHIDGSILDQEGLSGAYAVKL